MKRVCAWCKAEMGEKPGREDEITHGMCQDCYTKMKEDIKKMRTKHTYEIFIKSHVEAPDYEHKLEARNFEEAVDLFLKTINSSNPSPWNREDLKMNIRQICDLCDNEALQTPDGEWYNWCLDCGTWPAGNQDSDYESSKIDKP